MEIAKYGVGTQIEHPQFGLGVITKIGFGSYEVTFPKRGQVILNGTEFNTVEIVDEVKPDTEGVSVKDLENVLVGILQKWGDFQAHVPLGEKWKGGKLLLQPANPDLKPKELPIETFFHKLTMVRDRLRVMEQRINSSKNLGEEEKVNLQQYLTRIYGSLTTFNILFDRKEDHFRGAS